MGGKDMEKLEQELETFRGTLNKYKNTFGLIYTEGIKYLADNAKCYWLIDLVDSYQSKLKNIKFMNKNI